MESKIINLIDEQVALGFTGKLNFLSNYNRQYLGHVLFKNGDLIQASLNKSRGLKALFQMILEEEVGNKFNLVLEPELVEEKERAIYYPFSELKFKFVDLLHAHRESLKYRPPENIKIVIDAEFLEDSLPVTPEEFEVLKTLTEWSSPKELYEHCQLFEHEITMALVSLRKKEGLKVIAVRN
jgi:hypothetical protein